MWVQEFEGPAGQPPDPEVWTHEIGGGGWGDGQLQVYSDDPGNAALDGDGHLAITARRETDCAVTSARLTTRHSFATTYGRVEARIRVPGGRGTWPAFWMLGVDIDQVGWPACGEIDVMEHVARTLGAATGRCTAPATAASAAASAVRSTPARICPTTSTTTPSPGTSPGSPGTSTAASTTG